MKVLLLGRQSQGGLATHASDLVAALPEFDMSAEYEDASSWIPIETGPRNDKPVSKLLRKRAEGYDIVHALGYRAAWACSAAFGDKRPWVATAYDMPKTRHPLFVGRLNDAGAILCPSRAVRKALDDILVMNLEVLPIGVRRPEGNHDRDASRSALDLPETRPVIAGLGRWVGERGFDALLRAMDEVWVANPEVVVALAGAGPEEDELRRIASWSKQPDHVRFVGEVESPYPLMAAADAFIVPSRRAGTSMAAMEAMSIGTPVMLRDTGGLAEMIDPDLSGMLFDTDEQLGSAIAEMLALPLTLESLGGSGRSACAERFRVERNAERIAQVYQSVR